MAPFLRAKIENVRNAVKPREMRFSGYVIGYKNVFRKEIVFLHKKVLHIWWLHGILSHTLWRAPKGRRRFKQEEVSKPPVISQAKRTEQIVNT